MLPAYPLSTIDSKSKEGQKLAVGGRNPFQLDAKEPSGDFQDFLMGEVLSAVLPRQSEEAARAIGERIPGEV